MTNLSPYIFLVTSLALSNCSPNQHPAATFSAPVPFNETVITAEVVEAKAVDSTSLGIEPKQPIIVLELRLLSVQSRSEPNFVDGKPGEHISVYSKELAAAELNKTHIVATISFRGDERGGSFWAQEISALGPR